MDRGAVAVQTNDTSQGVPAPWENDTQIARCRGCGRVTWVSTLYLAHTQAAPCWCGSRAIRYAGKLSVWERIYVTRMLFWELCAINGRRWLWNPWYVAKAVWMGLTVDPYPEEKESE